MPAEIDMIPHYSSSIGERMPAVGKNQLQNSLSQISDCNIFFKGLSLVFGWAAYLPLSDQTIKNIGSSRSVTKLCSSTFSIPKMINQGISLHADVKELVCCVRISRECPNSGVDISKAVSDVFFSTVEMINKTAKVVCCLDKTKIIDLAMLAEGIPEQLEKVCFAANIIIFSHRFVSTANQYYLLSCRTAEQPESMRQEEGHKRKLMVKMASNAFKIFTSVIVGVSIFFPVVVSPVVAMGLSTASFLFTLGGALNRFKQNEDAHQRVIRSQPIYYLNA